MEDSPTSDSAREATRSHQRGVLLDAAIDLVSREGVSGLTLRKLARNIGTSTTAVYTYFGSKPALLEALHWEALDRMGVALEQVQVHPPLVYLFELAMVYRQFALNNRGYYGLVTTAVGTQPAQRAKQLRESRPFRVLHRAVELALDQGVFAPGDPNAISDALWAAVHGHVSLELNGYLDERVADQRFITTGQAILRGFTRGPAG